MISPLPDLSALYSPAAHRENPFAFPGEEGEAPKQGGKMDRADLSALAKEFAKRGGAFALFEFEYQSVHSVSLYRDAHGVSRQEYWQQSFEMNLTVGGDPEAAKALFEKMKEQFSPEKVAGRIADFALGISAGRDQAFRDLIRSAVELGYSQARDMLGPVDEEVAAQLEETLKRVRELLQPEQDQEDKSLELSSVLA